MSYRVLLAINAAVAVALAAFALWDLADGPPSEGVGMLFLMLAVTLGAIFAGRALYQGGNKVLGLILLAPIAWVGGLYGLFLLSVLILQPSFR